MRFLFFVLAMVACSSEPSVAITQAGASRLAPGQDDVFYLSAWMDPDADSVDVTLHTELFALESGGEVLLPE